MKSSLKEQLARLGPIRALDRVPSGLPAVLALRPGQGLSEVKPVSAAIVLARRGLSMLKAKRALEEMLSAGRAVVRLPSVESVPQLVAELAESGIRATPFGSNDIDVKAVRERLHLTQEQFALRFGLELDSIQNWETKRRKLDTAMRSYLRVIERIPDSASEALEAAKPE